MLFNVSSLETALIKVLGYSDSQYSRRGLKDAVEITYLATRPALGFGLGDLFDGGAELLTSEAAIPPRTTKDNSVRRRRLPHLDARDLTRRSSSVSAAHSQSRHCRVLSTSREAKSFGRARRGHRNL